ncbi:TPA: ACR family protein [Patescibacteria group bacterium]|nr:ACR family protein [Patescibacteria group bacterium]
MAKINLSVSSVCLIIGLVLLGGVVAYNSIRKTSDYPQIIFPDGRRINLIDIADTDAKRAQGLSGRSSLGSDEGMWFIFDQEGIYPFWMKDMQFSLDLVWVSQNYQVVDIVRDVPIPLLEDSSLPTYANTQPALFVLEVNSGVAQSLQLGDQLKWVD